jgi:hypothetical protein
MTFFDPSFILVDVLAQWMALPLKRNGGRKTGVE